MVVQVSRFFFRSGLSSDLPNSFEEGEPGFSIDTGELFIGAPELVLLNNRSVYPFMNLQILTELSQIPESQVIPRFTLSNPINVPMSATTQVFTLTKSSLGLNFMNKVSIFIDFSISRATNGIAGSFYISNTLDESTYDVLGDAATTPLDDFQFSVVSGSSTNSLVVVQLNNANAEVGTLKYRVRNAWSMT